MKQEILIPRDTGVYKPNKKIRNKILTFQKYLQSLDTDKHLVFDDKGSETHCPLEHSFSDGMLEK